MRRRLAAWLVTIGVLGACGFDGAGSGPGVAPRPIDAGEAGPANLPPGSDGAAPDGDVDGGPDGSLDAGLTTLLAKTGTVHAPSGLAMQTHLFYATHSARWWLFAIDDLDTLAMRTYSSTDFATWTPGTALTLPATHANEGANYSAAYGDIAGVDVVHLAFAHEIATTDRRSYHTRAIIAGASITFELPNEVTSITEPAAVAPAGCATVIGADGHVVDFTGWAAFGGDTTNTGNQNAFHSSGIEIGISGPSILGLRADIQVSPKTVNSRKTIALDGAELLALWERGDVEPTPTNVFWSRYNGATWSSAVNVFNGGGSQAANDWGLVRLSDLSVHAVRRNLTGTYEHRKFGTSSWSDLAAPPALASVQDGGLVLLAQGTHMLAAVIANDAAKSIRASTWDGVAWSAWATLEGSTAARSYLSGVGTATAGGALIWTEEAAGKTEIHGRRVAF